jgi:hypothetical protein
MPEGLQALKGKATVPGNIHALQAFLSHGTRSSAGQRAGPRRGSSNWRGDYARRGEGRAAMDARATMML